MRTVFAVVVLTTLATVAHAAMVGVFPKSSDPNPRCVTQCKPVEPDDVQIYYKILDHPAQLAQHDHGAMHPGFSAPLPWQAYFKTMSCMQLPPSVVQYRKTQKGEDAYYLWGGSSRVLKDKAQPSQDGNYYFCQETPPGVEHDHNANTVFYAPPVK